MVINKGGAMTTNNYNLYELRHNLIEQDMLDNNEDLAIRVLENWYEGRDSEPTVIRKLVKLGVIEKGVDYGKNTDQY